MVNDESTYVSVWSGPFQLVEMLAVLLESEGFVVATRPEGDRASLLVRSLDADRIRSFISKWDREAGLNWDRRER